MFVVFGLGNPGLKYEGTRHNVGVETLQKMAAYFQVKLKKRCFSSYEEAIANENIKLVFPLTYMNRSGKVVNRTVKEFDELIVICDQMDLPCGKIRLKRGGSSAGHNGLKSMLEAYPQNFIRMYIGVGRPQEGISVSDHVLSRFSEQDRALIEKAEAKAAEILEKLLCNEQTFAILQGEANSWSCS